MKDSLIRDCCSTLGPVENYRNGVKRRNQEKVGKRTFSLDLRILGEDIKHQRMVSEWNVSDNRIYRKNLTFHSQIWWLHPDLPQVRQEVNVQKSLYKKSNSIDSITSKNKKKNSLADKRIIRFNILHHSRSNKLDIPIYLTSKHDRLLCILQQARNSPMSLGWHKSRIHIGCSQMFISVRIEFFIHFFQCLNECVLESAWNEDVVGSYTGLTEVDNFTPKDTFGGQFEVAARVDYDGQFST